MTALRKCWIPLGVALFATMTSVAPAATNLSGQWWAPSESGWGLSVHQQADVLFLDLMVYRGDGTPAWFTAAAFRRPAPGDDESFAGDLYETSAAYPWPAYPPGAAARNVGTIAFTANGARATLAWTIDGTSMQKIVVPQTWRRENLAGVYDATWKWGCNGGPVGAGSLAGDWSFTETIVRHDANDAVSVRVALWASWYEIEHAFSGRFSQAGRLGRVDGAMVPPESGVLSIVDIETTAVGFTGRLVGQFAGCTLTDGRVAAVRRP